MLQTHSFLTIGGQKGVQNTPDFTYNRCFQETLN